MVERLAELMAKALVAERDELLPAGLDDPLPDVPGQAAIAMRLRLHQERLRRDISLNAEQMTPEGIAMVLEDRTARAQAAAYWAEEFPRLLAALERERPDVQEFLRAAATAEGAPISLLTPEVHRRLEQDGHLDEFRIRRQ
jgi:hypothetical protein